MSWYMGVLGFLICLDSIVFQIGGQSLGAGLLMGLPCVLYWALSFEGYTKKHLEALQTLAAKSKQSRNNDYRNA